MTEILAKKNVWRSNLCFVFIWGIREIYILQYAAFMLFHFILITFRSVTFFAVQIFQVGFWLYICCQM